ncbi:MAG: nucleotidyltransferase domain-containing protein, partial [Bacillota bacterium]
MTAIRKEQIKSKLLPFFSERKEVLFAYLFGSVAKESAGRISDIDIAVYLDFAQITQGNGYGYKSELLVDLQNVL